MRMLVGFGFVVSLLATVAPASGQDKKPDVRAKLEGHRGVQLWNLADEKGEEKK